jgi:hypothetical protein
MYTTRVARFCYCLFLTVFENPINSPDFWTSITTVKVSQNKAQESKLNYTLRDLFTNSSGHPDTNKCTSTEEAVDIF